MPRASHEQILQALHHERREVRSLALERLANEHVAEPTAMVQAIAAMEQFGLDDAFLSGSHLASLGQSPETIDWVLQQLQRITPSVKDVILHRQLCAVLTHANPRLVVPRRADVGRLVGVSPHNLDLLAFQGRLMDADDAGLWQELDAFCELWKSKQYLTDIPHEQGAILVAEMGRRQVAVPATFLAELNADDPNPLGKASFWRLPLLLKLAGRLRHEPAIPYLLALLGVGDVVAQEASEALGRIGTDAMLDQFWDTFDRKESRRESYFSGVLEHVHSDRAVAVGIQMIQDPRPSNSDFLVGISLCLQFSTEANEAVYALRDTDSWFEVEDVFVWSCRLLGQTFPELDVMQKNQEVENRRVEQLTKQMERVFAPPPVNRPLPKAPPSLAPPQKLAPRPVPGKVGRNDPCPCGSGKKFKKCCLSKS